MSLNPFLDKASPPTPKLLAKTLGSRTKYFEELKQHLPPSVVEEWKYYGRTIGWTLKLLLGKRNRCFGNWQVREGMSKGGELQSR